MPDLTSSPALDVAIGLSLVYFVLALLCSGLNEFVARIFSLRAKKLEQGIRNLLNDPQGVGKAKDVLSHPLVQGLKENGAAANAKKGKTPSYIPSATFALALFDTLAPPEKGQSRDLVAKAREAVDGLQDDELKTALATLVDDAEGDRDAFRKNVEDWFNAAMDRVSGWYKRQVQVILFCVGLALVALLNVDSFQVGNSLWNDSAVRSAVVAQAQQTAKKSTTGKGNQDLRRAANQVNQLKALKLPIGWSSAKNDPRNPPNGFSAWAAKVLGWLITALAISLGAPFWFDILGRARSLRASGKPEGAGASARSA